MVLKDFWRILLQADQRADHLVSPNPHRASRYLRRFSSLGLPKYHQALSRIHVLSCVDCVILLIFSFSISAEPLVTWICVLSETNSMLAAAHSTFS